MENKDYIILREGGDIDLLTKRGRLKNTINYFKQKGFMQIDKRFYHISLRKLSDKAEILDLQFGGLNQNKSIFFSEDYFFNKKYSQKMILNLALLLHLIVNKGEITKKRKKEFYNGFDELSKKEQKNFFDICKKEYGNKITKKIKDIVEKKPVSIKKLKWQIIFKKSSLSQIVQLPFILAHNQIYKYRQKRKIYIISFLGVDGSGKTTSINNLSRYLEGNSIKHSLGNLGVYHQRSFFMNFLSKFIKKEKNKKKAQQKLNINYTRKSFIKNLVRTIDIYIRYRQTIRKTKKENKRIIIFDRYFYDLLLQSKIDFLSRMLLKITPKPNKLFFLHAEPKDIYKRKRERNPVVLEEQINKFKKEITGISKLKYIETKTEKQTLDEIIKELNNKEFLSCV